VLILLTTLRDMANFCHHAASSIQGKTLHVQLLHLVLSDLDETLLVQSVLNTGI
jgi:hypothetical protein